jgi:hypothetical protein
VVADVGRARRIINRRASTLRNRSEQELAGYRDAQDYLFQQGWRPLNAGLILHLHRLQHRIREHILRHAPARFRLADIRAAVPGVSDQTIRLVLEQLRKEGKVRSDGTGRAATWTRTNTAPSE